MSANFRWRVSAEIGRIYIYRAQEDKDRICHDSWRPPEGSLCLCLEHSGDHYYDYLILRKLSTGGLVKGRKFGAYSFGKDSQKLSNRKFHLACAGEII